MTLQSEYILSELLDQCSDIIGSVVNDSVALRVVKDSEYDRSDNYNQDLYESGDDEFKMRIQSTLIDINASDVELDFIENEDDELVAVIG